MTEAGLYQFLSACRLGVISSLGPGEVPQSALIGIAVTSGLEIVFDTLKTSRKYGNLVARPRCSLVAGWSGEETVQYEGVAEELKSPELERFQAVYFETWPECVAHIQWPDIVYFVVRPRWIRYSDFGKTPTPICEFNYS